jgi:hypothetical protein
MQHPRDCGVLLAAPRCSGAVRRRRDVAVPSDDYFVDFSFIAVIFGWDVLKIRPLVLVTPSLVAEFSSRVPRRLFFCRAPMVLLLTIFSFAATSLPDDLHPN